MYTILNENDTTKIKYSSTDLNEAGSKFNKNMVS